MLLLLMYLNGVTVVETTLNISEKNTCPKRPTTSKPNYDGEMLMRYKYLGALLKIVALCHSDTIDHDRLEGLKILGEEE